MAGQTAPGVKAAKTPSEQAAELIAMLVLLAPMLEGSILELEKKKGIKTEIRKGLLETLQKTLAETRRALTLSKEELAAS